jgi:hypothetical protein
MLYISQLLSSSETSASNDSSYEEESEERVGGGGRKKRGEGDLMVIIVFKSPPYEIEIHWHRDSAVVVRKDGRVHRIGKGLIVFLQHQRLNHFQETLLELSWECGRMEMFGWVGCVCNDRIPGTDPLIVTTLP